jgi:hypothetical protein
MQTVKQYWATLATSFWVRAPEGGIRRTAAWLLVIGCVLCPTLLLGSWLVRVVPLVPNAGIAGSGVAALRLVVAGLCSVTGVAVLVRAVLGARRRIVAAEATYEQLTTGMVALLQAGYRRGEVTLAEYEAGLSRVLPPTECLMGARGRLRLTLARDTRRRVVAASAGAVLLAAGLAGLALEGAPTDALVRATTVRSAVIDPPVPGDTCPSWLPPGHRRKCWQRQRAVAGATQANPRLG